GAAIRELHGFRRTTHLGHIHGAGDRAGPLGSRPAPVRSFQGVVATWSPGAQGVVGQPRSLGLLTGTCEAFVQNAAVSVVRAQVLRPDLVTMRAVDVPGRKRVIIVLHVHLMSQGDLAQIGDTVRTASGVTRLGEHGKQNAGKNGYDCYNN